MSGAPTSPTTAAPWALAIVVALGGGLGSLARYAAVHAIHQGHANEAHSGHPQLVALLAINLAGGMLAGAAVTWWSKRAMLGSKRFAFLVPGFCGGFTTFSSWALEAAHSAGSGSGPEASTASVAALSCGLLIGLVAATLGRWLARPFARPGAAQ